MQTAIAGSVIVRVGDGAEDIGRTLEVLRDQTVAAELIVVASGSADNRLEIAGRHADRLIEIPPERFTLGRALNMGAEAASAPIHFTLSPQGRPEGPDWIERSLAYYERSDIAATNGIRFRPDGSALRAVLYQDAATAPEKPLWGFSNQSASWRATVWAQHPFNESLVASEDKEWSWRVLQAGWLVVHDPFLCVSFTGGRRRGLGEEYARTEREARELTACIDLPPYELRDAVHEWWNGYRPDTRYPPLFHRANCYRVADIAGKYVGGIRGRRRRASVLAADGAGRS